MRTPGISSREGWHRDARVDDEADHVAFFQAGGMIVSLWDRDRLARVSAVEDPGSWAGVTLGYRVGSPQEVDRVLAEARRAVAFADAASGSRGRERRHREHLPRSGRDARPA